MQLTDSEVSVETCNIAYILIIFIKRKPPFPFFFFVCCVFPRSERRMRTSHHPSPLLISRWLKTKQKLRRLAHRGSLTDGNMCIKFPDWKSAGRNSESEARGSSAVRVLGALGRIKDRYSTTAVGSAGLSAPCRCRQPLVNLRQALGSWASSCVSLQVPSLVLSRPP